MKDLILIIVSILWCIPILISFVISGLRKKLESRIGSKFLWKGDFS